MMMNGGRRTRSSPPEKESPERCEGERRTERRTEGRTERRTEGRTEERTEERVKINRLKRSPKTQQTQRADPQSSTDQDDFKTPTRVPKSGFRSAVSEESPNYDPELQHEIIWDPTSPATPVRNGRGRRRTAAFKSVDISDIVNRIAPKNKRSEQEADSTLLQWIGDTAVPCTPEIREPRAKPKPARQNPVEDLLKLAKQFDFNMFHQEKAHLQPDPRSSAEAMCEDQDLFFDKGDPPASPHSHSNAERPSLASEDKQEMDDDLDLLFDGSTQQLSGGLSQGFSSRSQDVVTFTPQVVVKTDSVKSVTSVRGASQSSAVSVRVAAPTLRHSTIKQVGAVDDFDDDWNNDDLLDDSLVMEMTQNPELFSAPQCSSTQKQANKNVFCRNNDIEAKSGEPERFRQRLNEATGNKNVWKSGSNSKTQVFPPSKVPSKVPGSHSVPTAISQPKKQMENQQRLATTSANPTWSSSSVSRSYAPQSVSSATTETVPTLMINKITKKKENPAEDDVLCDLAGEDLDSIFASDDIWDDGADDDDLFCEVCEKVEESMAEPEPPPKASVSKTTPQTSHIQGTHKTTSKSSESRFTQPPPSSSRVYNLGAPGNRAPSSTETLPGAHHNTSVLNNNTVTSSERTYRFSRVKRTTGKGSDTYNAARYVSESATASATATAGQSYQSIQDHQFKKPYSTFNAAPDVSKDVSKAGVTRCSDAEIERKKQQAMERRRLRMQANQNLPAPV